MKNKKIHFKLAYLKLTGFYVLIIMTISISFSFALYRIYSREIDRGLGRQTRALGDFQIKNLTTSPFYSMEALRNQIADESLDKIRADLIYFNLLILVMSAILAYFFAQKTLLPIEKSIEEQNRFTADASHELRTPLAAIRSEIEVNLRDKGLTLDQAKEILQSNLEEVDKLEALSSSLLQLSHNEEKNHLSLEKVNLAEVIIEAYEKIAQEVEAKEITFENKLKNINVWAERRSLTEIMVILLDNAVKYSPAKSKIQIILTAKEKHANIAIKDYGIGIKSSDLPYIFNRFYRADHSRNKEK